MMLDDELDDGGGGEERMKESSNRCCVFGITMHLSMQLFGCIVYILL